MTEENIIIDGLKHALVAAVLDRMLQNGNAVTASEVATAIKTAIREESDWQVTVVDIDKFDVQVDFKPDENTTKTLTRVKDRFYRELTQNDSEEDS